MTVVVRARVSSRVAAALVMAVAIAGCGTGKAWGLGQPVGLSVVDRDSGEELPVWRHAGRFYVAGRTGARYSLRISNHTQGRVLTVLSVDGVNILSGETAGYDQNGYVLDPYESYDIEGWRKSTTEVAAFTFAPLPQSYAARTGRPGDVGVIGMAVFKERAPRPYPQMSQAPPSVEEPRWGPIPTPPAMVVPAPQAAPPALADGQARSGEAVVTVQRREADRLGTAHGAREWSVVTTVPFERATRGPQYIQQIEYDSYANLVARGVIPRTPPEYGHRPRPFPGGGGYVPDPPPERW